MNTLMVEFFKMILDIWFFEADGLMKITQLFQLLTLDHPRNDDELDLFNELYRDEDGDMTRDLLEKMLRERCHKSPNAIFSFLHHLYGGPLEIPDGY